MPKIEARANVVIRLLGFIILVLGIAVIDVALNVNGEPIHKLIGYIVGGVLSIAGIIALIAYIEE